MLSFFTHSLIIALAASRVVQAGSPHNVTIKNSNSKIRYYPSTGTGAWSKWPYAGCLDTTGGMWTASSGPIQPTVSLTFTGTDIYVFGQFDDETSLPIYIVSVDGIPSEKMGSQGILHTDRCNPIYSKTGLTQSQHTVVLQLTTDRPGDIRDLAFDGFIYTTTVDSDTGSTSTTTAGSSTTTSGSSNNSGLFNPFGFALGTPAIIGIVAGVVVIFVIILGFFIRRRRAMAQAHAQQAAYQESARPPSMDEVPPPRPTTFYAPPAPQPYMPPAPQPYMPPVPQFNQNPGYNMAPYQYNNAPPQQMYAPPPIQPPWSPPPSSQRSFEPAPSPWNPNMYHAATDSNSHLLSSSTTPSSPYTGSQGQPAYFDQNLGMPGVYDPPQHRQPSPAESFPAPSASPHPSTVDYQAHAPAPLANYEVDAIAQRVRDNMRDGSGGENAKAVYAPVTARGDGSGSSSSAPRPSHQADPSMYLPRNEERPQAENTRAQPPPHPDAPPPTYQS